MVRNVILLLLAAACVLASLDAVRHGGEASRLRADAALVADARFGILDATEWRVRLERALRARIDAFELTEANRPALKAQLERLLDRLIVELAEHQRRQVARGGSVVDQLIAELRRGAAELVFDVEALRAEVPDLADAALEELSSQEFRDYLKTALSEALARAAEDTFGQVDRRPLERALRRHGCEEPGACARTLETEAARAVQASATRAGIAVAFAVAVIVLFARRRDDGPVDSTAVTLAGVGLLAGGVAIPMIRMEARIRSLELTLLGEPVTFENQVLYHQNKSILDVVQVLVDSGQWDLVGVAVLVALFSVVFPLLKLAATLVYQHARRWREHGAVRFFALRSGKWSMADVMVVTLLMAFIGFRGIAESQLARMETRSDALEVLTTNGTSLEVGFHLFLAWCLFSMVVSHLIERRRTADARS